jgi:hypothetical protein
VERRSALVIFLGGVRQAGRAEFLVAEGRSSSARTCLVFERGEDGVPRAVGFVYSGKIRQ